MSKIQLTIAFIDDDGIDRTEIQTIENPIEADFAGEKRLKHNLFVEFRSAVIKQTEPKHNSTALSWLNFASHSIDLTKGIQELFDVQNARAIWQELAHLVMSAELDIILARTFKEMEPIPPSFEGDEINHLYYIHDRKMSLFDASVYSLIKVQNLVDRLLHESLGGDLVDTTQSEWEKTELVRKKILRGLEDKRARGVISQAEFDQIDLALKGPMQYAKNDLVVRYRNRLAHHIHPTVDYPLFYRGLHDRDGKEILGPDGSVVGRQYGMFSQQQIDFQFSELSTVFTEYLATVVDMLNRLSKLKVLRGVCES
jgi:hypothetical protein